MEPILDKAIEYLHREKGGGWAGIPEELWLALEERYGSREAAKTKVRIRIRERRNQALWPADWPEHTSPEGMLRRFGGAISEKDRDWLERMCAATRRTRRPPALNHTEKKRMERYCTVREAFRLMGIPYFKNRVDLRRMMVNWNEDRQQGSARPG